MNEEHQEKEKDVTIKIRKQDLWKYATFIFAALFVISLFWHPFFNGTGTTGPTGNTQQIPPDTTTGPTGNLKVNIEANDPVLGSKNAPITIVEYSDFQCPFCERAYSGAIASFKQSDYFKSGKVNLVYKEFPLNSIHPFAQKAAEAAECANRQGKFWEYHNMLFENQQALDIPSLKSYATKVGLDTTKFNKCLDSGEAKDEVDKEEQQAQTAGGQGTPYFVLINKDGKTQAVSGAVPWSNFESAITALS